MMIAGLGVFCLSLFDFLVVAFWDPRVAARLKLRGSQNV